jgi:hypothetical protein
MRGQHARPVICCRPGARCGYDGRLRKHVNMTERATEMSSATTTPRNACSAGAQRMRAHRQRRRDGLRCIVVQLRETEIDELIRRKLLQADARKDVHGIRMRRPAWKRALDFCSDRVNSATQHYSGTDRTGTV